MKWGFALVAIIRMDHWLKVPNSRIIYKILVEAICSFHGKHNRKYKKFFQNTSCSEANVSNYGRRKF